MKTDIQRQYDEIIAPHYDLDPQQVTTNALGIALGQLSSAMLDRSASQPLDLLDVGIGRHDEDNDRVLGEGGGVEGGGPWSEAGQTWNGPGQARAGGG